MTDSLRADTAPGEAIQAPHWDEEAHHVKRAMPKCHAGLEVPGSTPAGPSRCDDRVFSKNRIRGREANIAMKRSGCYKAGEAGSRNGVERGKPDLIRADLGGADRGSRYGETTQTR